MEIKALVDSSKTLDSEHGLGKFSVITFRTLLLLLYGAGLRSGEAVSLTIADVNLSDRLLIVRNAISGTSVTAMLSPVTRLRAARTTEW
jgi:integrase